MKKKIPYLIAVSLISALIVNVNCKNAKEKQASFIPSPPDTTKTPGVYVNYPHKNILVGIVYITSRDTFAYRNIDTTGGVLSGKKELLRDSIFYVARTDDMGNYLKDSTGFPRIFPTFPQLVSLHRNVDSAVNILDRVVKANPQLFPADTTKKQ